MEMQEIELVDLVDALEEANNDYADFFRPMLGYEAILTLYLGITDEVETQLIEIEDETGYEFPPDLISFYVCSNGGEFGDLDLYPITNDPEFPINIHRLNVTDKSLKESIGLDNKTLLIGGYPEDDTTYVTCRLNSDGSYKYQLYDATKQSVKMEFDYLLQLVALEINYITDYDELVDYANSKED